MAMRQIPMDITASSFMVVTPSAPKIKNQETGEIATHRETGETLHTISVVEMADGRADVLKLTIRATGVPEGLAPGTPVRPVGLVAIPWARLFNGQLSDGVAYRADALKPAK
ncbi:hypothetical protein ACFVIM_02735 [Streptomyces sp. NPDC057638]|uniref:SCO3933 family regulatory protein n=1 Tax=Streptomyces sp. NPDC057638 TaxID=3346190 RepID=UPI0036A89FD0